MSKRTGGLTALLLTCALLFPALAGAQTGTRATLSGLQLDQFPLVSAHLDVRDAQGGLISDLEAGDITVIENGSEVPVSELRGERPGAQLVVAFNLADSFAIRDSLGNTRFDYLSRALQAWANGLTEDSSDDLSLVTPAGTPVSHTAEPAAWAGSLQAYQPDLEAAVPNLEMLSRALEQAGDPTPQPGMGRAVLFLTPYLEQSVSGALQSLADRAVQADVHVFVWMVDAPGLADMPGGLALRSLAETTGGRFAVYSGQEPIPDVEEFLEPLRHVYQLSYRSRITEAGEHTISVRVAKDDWELLTAPLTFNLDLQPPNPIFVSPPGEILRSVPQGAAPGQLAPTQQTIEILIEFPDGLNRDLARTTLYANGEPVAENTSPPFERFAWDLTSFETSERVMLVAEAEDELGLIDASIDTPVQISVERGAAGLRGLLSRLNVPLAAGIAVLAGAVLLLVLLLSGRIRPRPIGARRTKRAALNDPVTQPLTDIEPQGDEDEKGRLARFARRLSPSRPSWPQPPSKAKPLAYLARIDEADEPISGKPVTITSPEVTFGSDPAESTVVVEEPSVEKLHARLWRDEQDCFHLADQDSTAGTWVNYAPVSQEGCQVEHGDLIHIGRVGFRFSLTEPNRRGEALVRGEEGGE